MTSEGHTTSATDSVDESTVASEPSSSLISDLSLALSWQSTEEASLSLQTEIQVSGEDKLKMNCVA